MVNPDPRNTPFGRYLKAIRTQEGVSLEEVAYQTHLGMRELMLIEEENHDELPEPDQVKTMLRAYARFMGVDGDDIVDRYDINRSFFYHPQGPDEKIAGSWTKRLLVIIAALLVLILAGLGAGYWYFGELPNVSWLTGDRVYPPPACEPPAPDDAPPPPVPVEPVPAAPTPAPAEKLVLKVDALREILVKIGTDGAEPIHYLLHPNEHIEVQASERFRVELSDPAGVTIFLNDEPVGINSLPGQMVTLDLPLAGPPQP